MATALHLTEYEQRILVEFARRYPPSDIRRDAHLLGALSDYNYQIDILVDAEVGGTQLRMIIGAKMYNKPMKSRGSATHFFARSE